MATKIFKKTFPFKASLKYVIKIKFSLKVSNYHAGVSNFFAGYKIAHIQMSVKSVENAKSEFTQKSGLITLSFALAL